MSAFDACDRAYFRVSGADEFGDVTSADVAGSPFELNLMEIGGLAFHNNFEADNGWTLSGDFERGAPQASGSGSGDPASAFSGDGVLGIDLSGSGDYTPSSLSSAESPAFNTVGMSNLELIINTPVSTAQLMVGKVIPYIVVGLVQVALIVKVGQWLFKVPVAGSMVDLYLAACVFIAANLALGLLISTFVKTQFQAIQITIFFIMPSILLSGFVFPFEGMPRLIQYVGEAIPNTHFIRLIRGIMLRDASLSQLSHELWILAGFTAVAMTVAILRFNKRLD